MSKAVVLYQLAILVSIVGIGTVVGQRSMVWASIAWAIWTLVMVFTRWLFILQFATIVVAYFSGFAIQESARYPAIQSSLRKGLLWLGVLAAVGLGVGLYIEHTQRRDYVAPLELTPQGQTQRIPDETQANEANLMAQAKSRVNQKYPQLDPSAFNYSYFALADVLARQQSLIESGQNPASAFENAADQVMSERTPKPEPGKVYRCAAKRGGQTHISYQDFPCGATQAK